MKPFIPSCPAAPTPVCRGLSSVIACASAVLLGVAAAANCGAQTVTDDFNDGNDTGWARYDPLGGLGAGAQTQYTFPNGNSYRMQCPPSVFPAQAGPPRGGAVRSAVYTDFYVSVDIIDWNFALDQSIGLLARVSNPGLGTLNCYAFTYEPGDCDISLVTGEAPIRQLETDSNVMLEQGQDYRFVFIGRGSQLIGEIYRLPDVTTPIKVVSGVDTTYTSGTCGLVVFDSGGANTGCDCTFDNYFSAPVVPPPLDISFNVGFQEVTVSWPTNSGTFRLQRTGSLIRPISWTDIDPAFIFPAGSRMQYSEGLEEDLRVFRLIRD